LSWMAWFRDASIWRRLMLINILISCISLLSITVILAIKDYAEWRSQTVSALMANADVIGTNAASALLFDDPTAAYQTLSSLSANSKVEYAEIHDRQGNLFATFLGPGQPVNPPPRLESGRYLFTRHTLTISKSIRLKNDALGTITLVSDLHEMYMGIVRDTGLIFAAMAAIFLLTTFLFAGLQKTIIGPILDLAKAMQTVSRDQNYEIRVAAQAKDEVGTLARTFNGMLDGIQTRDVQLAQHRQHLEDEVATRTTDLTAANKQLARMNEKLEDRVKERTQQLLQAQDELVRKEKLAVLGQVAGSVGHELRNPLAVMNNAVFLLQTVLSGADDTVKEYLGIIKEEIAGAEHIVSDLLDSVRTRPPQTHTIGIDELLSQTLRKCTVPDGVRIESDVPKSLPPLQVDPLQIQQVLRNLINNGMEAMPDGGVLEILASADTVANTVTVRIRDSGTGMTAENLAKLFQPLFTTKARGIGLGLVVVKNLTQANGGKIEVQSEPGHGSSFSITFPAQTILAKTA
jgi:signal transduction histidine kinase